MKTKKQLIKKYKESKQEESPVVEEVKEEEPLSEYAQAMLFALASSLVSECVRPRKRNLFEKIFRR